MNPYFDNAATPWTELGDGIRRKIVGQTPDLMSVLVQFDKGAIGTPHAHDAHDQIAVVLAGSFEADVAGVKRVLRVGDAFTAPRLHSHGVVALEDGSVLLDQFSPRRNDLPVGRPAPSLTFSAFPFPTPHPSTPAALQRLVSPSQGALRAPRAWPHTGAPTDPL